MNNRETDAREIQQDLQKAVALHQSGETGKAARLYERILERAPSQPDALNLLGIIRSADGQIDIAIDLLMRAVHLRPKSAGTLNNLGRVLIDARRYEEAIAILERALSLSKDVPECIGNLVQAHRMTGNIEEAIYYVKLLKEQGTYARTADFEYATILSDLGERAQALEIARKMIADKPGFSPAWHLLVQLQEFGPSDPEVDQVTMLALQASNGSKAKRTLCHAAGKLLDGIGDFERAFQFIALAKEQVPGGFDPEDATRHMEAIQSVYDANFFSNRSGFGVASNRPVFVVGMPRSGTTLAEHILSAYDEVYGGGELEYIGQISVALRDHIPDSVKQPTARELRAETVTGFAYQYLRKIATRERTTKYFIDKMPQNFLHIGLIKLMFPHAKIVHCMRHPYDTCLSCYMQDFSQSHSYNRTLESLATYYNAYRGLMSHWKGLFGDDMFDLQYERLVADPGGTAKQLSDFLGLLWRDDVLDTAANDRWVATPSKWQVRKPIYGSSAGKWKNYEKWILPGLEGIKKEYLD